MPDGLISLGVSAAQILASILANIAVDSARAAASSKMKGRAVHAEHFRRVVQTDIDEVKEKLNSLAQSRLRAAFDYIKRGLVILQSLEPAAVGENPLESNSLKRSVIDYGKFPSPNSYREHIRLLIKDAERFFAQADIWATEAFNDKANVPISSRLECVRVQLFCAMMLHWEKPRQWLLLWRSIFADAIRDGGVAQTALSFNPWLSRSQKALIRTTLISVINEAVCSLWKIAHDDPTLADTAAEVLNFVRAPVNILREQYHETWRTVVGLPMNSFCGWLNRLVVVIPECYRICEAPDNCLCVVDRRFKINLLDAVTLQLVKLKSAKSCSTTAEDDWSKNEFSSVAYDQVQALILAIQFQPNRMVTFKFGGRDEAEFSLQQTVNLPEPGYSIKCTPSNGHWVFRSASGRVYLMENGGGDWLPVTEHVSKVFDVKDEAKMTLCPDSDFTKLDSIPFYTSFGVGLLKDFKIESYYYNASSADRSKSVFILRSSRTVDPKLISRHRSSTTVVEQTVLSFDRSPPFFEQSLIVAQRLENEGVRLSRISEKNQISNKKSNDQQSPANDEFFEINDADISDLPFYFQETIEDVLVKERVVYLTTGKSLKLTEECKRASLKSAFKKFSLLKFRPSPSVQFIPSSSTRTPASPNCPETHQKATANPEDPA